MEMILGITFGLTRRKDEIQIRVGVEFRWVRQEKLLFTLHSNFVNFFVNLIQEILLCNF